MSNTWASAHLRLCEILSQCVPNRAEKWAHAAQFCLLRAEEAQSEQDWLGWKAEAAYWAQQADAARMALPSASQEGSHG